MNLLTIPLRNIRRRPLKAALLFTVFFLGIMSIVSLHQVSLVVGESLEKKLTAFGANIIIAPEVETLSVSYGGFNMGDMMIDIEDLPGHDTIASIRSIELNDRISAVAPKLVSMIKVNTTAVAVIGVDWENERKLKSYWALSGHYPQNPDELLLGSNAASRLGVTTGDSLQLKQRRFRVAGVLYETGSDDDSVIFAGLAPLQQLLGRDDAVSFIEVSALCSGCPIEDIVAQLRTNLPGASVKALQNVVNQRMASIHFVQRLALSVSLVILLTAATMVGLSMLSSVNERRKDIGLMRSLGYTRLSIFQIFCTEAGLIGILAGLSGYLAGYAISFKALDLLTMTKGATPVFSLTSFALTGLLFALISILASLYPAWKGASMDPSSALITI